MAKKIKRNFYYQDAPSLAKNLLNKYIIINNNPNKIIAKIVETEAYQQNDKASHSYQNKKTKKNSPMFLKGGHLYIYTIYGIYNCFNIVCQKKDIGQAVLIRAIEPLNNFDLIRSRRKVAQRFIDTTNGPGKLCRALLINNDYNNIDLLDNNYIKIATDYIINDNYSITTSTITYDILKAKKQNFEIIACRRIGIGRAKDDQHLKWRFYIKNNCFVSYQIKL